MEFILDLTPSTYSNYSTMETCLPLKFTKKSNKAQKMDAQMMTVNTFFGHWFTDIDIKGKLIGLKFLLFMINLFNTQLFTIVMI